MACWKMTLAAFVSAAGLARAQVQTTNATAEYTLSWQDDGNHNGIVEPGESAVVRLTVTVTPAIDTAIDYVQNGVPHNGTLRGFGAGFIDIDGGNLLGGTLTPGAIDPTWAFLGNTPSVSGSSIHNIRFGQLPPGLSQIRTTNPIVDVFGFTWTPSVYSDRIATFQTAVEVGSNQASAVLIVTGAMTFIAAACLDDFGGLEIPVAGQGCYANCDGSTEAPVLNVLDFNCFLDRFNSQALYANCDGSTNPPVLNVLDFNCFVNRFVAGCP